MASDRELSKFREKMDREMRAGVFKLILLAAVDRLGPVYGYELLKSINGRGTGRLEFKDGTAYPILRKLEKRGLVSSFWQEGEGGPPRKYYQTTELGQEALDQGLHDWRELVNDVAGLLTSMEQEAEQ